MTISLASAGTITVISGSARIVAISRERSEIAEYMVLSAPNTAPIAITSATRKPSTRVRYC